MLFWDVTWCTLVAENQYFEITYWYHHQGSCLSLTDGTDRLFKTLVINYQHKTRNNSGEQSAQLCFVTSLKEITDYLRRYAVLNLSEESLFVMLVLQTTSYAQFIRISKICIHTTFEILSSNSPPVNTVQLQATWRFSYRCHTSSDGLLWHNVLTRFCEKSIKHETGKHTYVNRTRWFHKYLDFFSLQKDSMPTTNILL